MAKNVTSFAGGANASLARDVSVLARNEKLDDVRRIVGRADNLWLATSSSPVAPKKEESKGKWFFEFEYRCKEGSGFVGISERTTISLSASSEAEARMEAETKLEEINKNPLMVGRYDFYIVYRIPLE